MSINQEKFDPITIMGVADDLARKCALKLSLRSEAASIWETVLSKISYVPVRYTSHEIAYHLAYAEGQAGNWVDLSCVIFWGDEHAAVWPMTLAQIDSE